jgi:hypothetical protein
MKRVVSALALLSLLSMAHGQEITQSTPPPQIQPSTARRTQIQGIPLFAPEVRPAPIFEESSSSSSPLIVIAPPGGGDDDPGDEVYCFPGMWVCPCPETDVCYTAIPPSSVPTPSSCNNELFYRPVTVSSYDLPIGAYHTFWWNQEILTSDTEIDHVEDGGPTSPGLSCFTSNNCGTLFADLSVGDVGYYAADNIYTATPDLPDSYGPNLAQCRASWDMEYYTSTWPGGTIAYKILGPNSNTFAFEASVAAALTTTKPPVPVPGWGQ